MCIRDSTNNPTTYQQHTNRNNTPTTHQHAGELSVCYLYVVGILVGCSYVIDVLLVYLGCWCVIGVLLVCWWVVSVLLVWHEIMQNGLWALGVFKIVARTRCGLFSVSSCPQRVLCIFHEENCQNVLWVVKNAQNAFWHYFLPERVLGIFFSLNERIRCLRLTYSTKIKTERKLISVFLQDR